MDAKKEKKAQEVFRTLCEHLKDRKWTYETHEADKVVTFGVNGDDIPMHFVLQIDAERELIRLHSPLNMPFPEEKRLDGAIATCQVNYRLADGSFDYEYTTGKVYFRMTSSYRDSLISKELFDYMISCACYTVDEYNDKFLMLAKGALPLESFLKK